MNKKYYQERGFNIYQEAWNIVFSLESGKVVFGPSVARDTANHYWQMRHPESMLVVDEQGYSVKFRVVPC